MSLAADVMGQRWVFGNWGVLERQKRGNRRSDLGMRDGRCWSVALSVFSVV